MRQSLLRVLLAYRETPEFQGAIWVTWAILFGFSTWLYLWSRGFWAMIWTDSFDLIPVVVSAVLSALIIDHLGIKGWQIGVGSLVVVLWLIPALDLLISPGCADLDSIEFYRTPDGTLDTRCIHTANMITEALTAIGGLVVTSALAAILVRLRRKD